MIMVLAALALLAVLVLFVVLISWAERASCSEAPEDPQNPIQLQAPDGHALAAYTPVPFVLEPERVGSSVVFSEAGRPLARAAGLLMLTGVVLSLAGVCVAVWFGLTGSSVALPLAFSACMALMAGAGAYEIRRSRNCIRVLTIDDSERLVRLQTGVNGLPGGVAEFECSLEEAAVMVHRARLAFRDASMAILWMPNAWFMLGCLFDEGRLRAEVRRVLPADLGARTTEGPPLADCRVVRRVF